MLISAVQSEASSDGSLLLRFGFRGSFSSSLFRSFLFLGGRRSSRSGWGRWSWLRFCRGGWGRWGGCRSLHFGRRWFAASATTALNFTAAARATTALFTAAALFATALRLAAAFAAALVAAAEAAAEAAAAVREQAAQAAAALRHFTALWHFAANVNVPAAAASTAAAQSATAESTTATAKEGIRGAWNGHNGQDQSKTMKVHFHNLHSRTLARRWRRQVANSKSSAEARQR